jgi:hypothetical protein
VKVFDELPGMGIKWNGMGALFQLCDTCLIPAEKKLQFNAYFILIASFRCCSMSIVQSWHAFTVVLGSRH